MTERPSFFGPNLRWIRKYYKLSQEELAEKLGLKRNNIASYELEHSAPGLMKTIQIARYFNFSPELMVLVDFREHPPYIHMKSLLEDRIDKLVDKRSSDLETWQAHYSSMESLIHSYEMFVSMEAEEKRSFTFSNADTQRILRVLKKSLEVIGEMLEFIEAKNEGLDVA